jgi:hypothetical protein
MFLKTSAGFLYKKGGVILQIISSSLPIYIKNCKCTGNWYAARVLIWLIGVLLETYQFFTLLLSLTTFR